MVILRLAKRRPSAILDFKTLQFLSCSPRLHTVLLTHIKCHWNRIIGQWVMAKKIDFQDGGRRHLEIKKIPIFGHVTVIGFNIWCSVPNFIKIKRFLTEIWRFWRFSKWRPSAILDFKNLQFLSCSPYRHAVLLPHTKLDNRSMNYGQKPILKMAAAAILNFKNFNFWSRDCHLVYYLL